MSIGLELHQTVLALVKIGFKVFIQSNVELIRHTPMMTTKKLEQKFQ